MKFCKLIAASISVGKFCMHIHASVYMISYQVPSAGQASLKVAGSNISLRSNFRPDYNRTCSHISSKKITVYTRRHPELPY
jgi:hypothetical protein